MSNVFRSAGYGVVSIMETIFFQPFSALTINNKYRFNISYHFYLVPQKGPLTDIVDYLHLLHDEGHEVGEDGEEVHHV